MKSFDLAYDAFQEITPDPQLFGKPGGSVYGASDGENGVQWNFWVRGEAPEAYLSINLEGMKYTDWPLSKFIQAELNDAKLPSLWPTLDKTVDPEVKLARDAWQAQARIPIVEALLGQKQHLSNLSEASWEATLTEALGCFDESKSFRGRAKQPVTRVKDGMKVDMWVTPHLNIFTPLWSTPPASHAEAYTRMRDLIQQLSPIHALVQGQCAGDSGNLKARGKQRFETLREAATFARRHAKEGSLTYEFLNTLSELHPAHTRGYYTVTSLRLVWWADDGSRLARILLDTLKLRAVVANQLLKEIKLPTDAKPTKKNPLMTNYFTDNDHEIAALVNVFENPLDPD